MFSKTFTGLKLGFWVFIYKLARRFELLTLIRFFGVCLSCKITYKILSGLQDYIKVDRSIDPSALEKYWDTWRYGERFNSIEDALEDENLAIKELFSSYRYVIKKWYYIWGIFLTL